MIARDCKADMKTRSHWEVKNWDHKDAMPVKGKLGRTLTSTNGLRGPKQIRKKILVSVLEIIQVSMKENWVSGKRNIEMREIKDNG